MNIINTYTKYNTSIYTRAISKHKIQISSTLNIQSLDVFCFNDNELQMLDSYERIEAPIHTKLNITCSKGKKIIIILANIDKSYYKNININKLSSFKKAKIQLKDESTIFPYMYSYFNIDSDSQKTYQVELKAFLSKIRINNISFEPESDLLSKDTLKIIDIYLCNVKYESSLIEEHISIANKYLNQNKLREKDLENKNIKSLIYKHINKDIKDKTISINQDLYCYENIFPKDYNSNMFTKLVIKTQFKNKIFYYPIEIKNYLKEYKGIEASKAYSFNIKLTRLGSDDEEFNTLSQNYDINISASNWHNKEDIIETF